VVEKCCESLAKRGEARTREWERREYFEQGVEVRRVICSIAKCDAGLKRITSGVKTDCKTNLDSGPRARCPVSGMTKHSGSSV